MHLLYMTPSPAPVSAHDVAAYILKQTGRITAMKLQKLVYYSQAWSLVWDEAQLFDEPIEAWANGPVVRALYELHKGSFDVTRWDVGDPARLVTAQRETVDAVIQYYGRKTAQQLSDLTHAEAPWKDARVGVPEGSRSNAVITTAALAEYYGSL